MKTTHTPGPWTVTTHASAIVFDGKPVEYFAVSHESHLHAGFVALDVAPTHLITSAGRIENESGLANAKLIAAAPELLAALDEIINDVRAMQGNPHWEHFAQLIQTKARAAIAKAIT